MEVFGEHLSYNIAAQKMKFSIKDLLKKPLMENFIFCATYTPIWALTELLVIREKQLLRASDRRIYWVIRVWAFTK